MGKGDLWQLSDQSNYTMLHQTQRNSGMGI